MNYSINQIPHWFHSIQIQPLNSYKEKMCGKVGAPKGLHKFITLKSPVADLEGFGGKLEWQESLILCSKYLLGSMVWFNERWWWNPLTIHKSTTVTFTVAWEWSRCGRFRTFRGHRSFPGHRSFAVIGLLQSYVSPSGLDQKTAYGALTVPGTFPGTIKHAVGQSHGKDHTTEITKMCNRYWL